MSLAIFIGAFIFTLLAGCKKKAKIALSLAGAGFSIAEIIVLLLAGVQMEEISAILIVLAIVGMIFWVLGEKRK
jgi:hypothetical protein